MDRGFANLGLRLQRRGPRSESCFELENNPDMELRMRILVAVAVITILASLLVAVQAKGCHYNVHLNPRLICTE